MKKENLRAIVVMAVVLIAYNFAVFMIPCLKTATFWISWVFTLLSFAVGGYAVYTSMMRNSDAKSRFYGFPIARIGVIYLIAQIVVGGIFMALGRILPWWLTTVLFTIGLAVAVIGLVSAEAVVDEIKVQDETLKKSVTLMRALQSKVGQMATMCQAPELKALSEELRYSDPVSSDAIADAEADLSAAVDALQQAVVEGDSAAIEQLCRKASLLLAERNRLCKLNK